MEIVREQDPGRDTAGGIALKGHLSKPKSVGSFFGNDFDREVDASGGRWKRPHDLLGGLEDFLTSLRPGFAGLGRLSQGGARGSFFWRGVVRRRGRRVNEDRGGEEGHDQEA